MKAKFEIVGKNDIETTIQCKDCGISKDIILDGDELKIMNEYCHGCQQEWVLVI